MSKKSFVQWSHEVGCSVLLREKSDSTRRENKRISNIIGSATTQKLASYLTTKTKPEIKSFRQISM
jgi:hypothetical protein